MEQRLQLAPARLLRGMQRAQGREQRGLGGEGRRVDLEQRGERGLDELEVAPAALSTGGESS